MANSFRRIPRARGWLGHSVEYPLLGLGLPASGRDAVAGGLSALCPASGLSDVLASPTSPLPTSPIRPTQAARRTSAPQSRRSAEPCIDTPQGRTRSLRGRRGGLP